VGIWLLGAAFLVTVVVILLDRIRAPDLESILCRIGPDPDGDVVHRLQKAEIAAAEYNEKVVRAVVRAALLQVLVTAAASVFATAAMA
jgi:hypothetical protein